MDNNRLKAISNWLQTFQENKNIDWIKGRTEFLDSRKTYKRVYAAPEIIKTVYGTCSMHSSML